jgi:inosine-uridine nucleoside N-ribohydrolase
MASVLRRALFVLVVLTSLGRRVGNAAERPEDVVLDTDGDADYDDVVGVMVAAVSPEVHLLGVVVTGQEAPRRARAVAKALDVMGRDDVAIHLGEPPGSPPPPDVGAPATSRGYGLRPELERWAAHFPLATSPESGVDFYLRTLSRRPGEVTVVVTGALSTLGRAIEVGDERGTPIGRAPRRVLFSGGDFDRVEFNVASDVDAARAVFRSGTTVWDFMANPDGDAFLDWDARQQIWRAGTPATWALQGLYRNFRAGWDPASPFVPILYDVHPIALLAQGQAISRFAPASVEVEATGRLRRADGPPNAQIRVGNDGEALVVFAIARVTDPVPPALNHLRALRRLVPSGSPLAREITTLVDAEPVDRASLLAALDRLASEVEPLGGRAVWHLEMARKFLAGEAPSVPWRDRYTPGAIAVIVALLKLAAFLRRFASLVAAGATAAIVLWWWRRHSDRRPPARRVVV